MSKYIINYKGEFSISIIVDNEDEAVEKASKASFWKTLKGLHRDFITIQQEVFEDEGDDCPECGDKLVYITAEVRHCKNCTYYEIDCPKCGSNEFYGFCWWCKHKEAGYVSCDNLHS